MSRLQRAIHVIHDASPTQGDRVYRSPLRCVRRRLGTERARGISGACCRFRKWGAVTLTFWIVSAALGVLFLLLLMAADK